MALTKQQVVTGTMTDEELAGLAREGCEQAFSLLVGRCTTMIKRHANSLSRSQIEAEDLAQEGLLGLLAAVRTYHSDISSFRTYASVCVRNKILSVIRGSGASRHIPLSELVSFDEGEDAPLSITGCSDDPAQLIVQKEEAMRLQDWLRGLLSKKEYKVLMLYLRAYSYDEIAKDIGIGVKAVDNSLQRVRRKLVTVPFPGS